VSSEKYWKNFHKCIKIIEEILIDEVKNMKFKPIYILFFVLISITAIGCAKPPLAEMADAREAVFRAENDPNAVQYSSGTLTRARAAIQNMEREAESKRYDTAKTHAAEAINAAERAITEGKAAAQRASQESATAIAGLKPEIEETSVNVNGARYSLLDLDYNALDNGIVNAYNTADKAENDQASGKYLDAIDKARTVRSDLADINQKIATAAPIKKK